MNYDYSDCKTVAEIIAKQIAEPDDPFADPPKSKSNNKITSDNIYSRYNLNMSLIGPQRSRKRNINKI